MKPPSAFEPELTAGDLTLVQEVEQSCEQHFAENEDSEDFSVTTDTDSRFARRHWNELVRRLRASGWRVNIGYNYLIIRRPALGRGETVVRLRVGHAATNLVSVVQLVARTPVEAVLDIYLDDVGLARLVTMHRFGVKMSSKLRLLTSTKGAKKMSKHFVADAFQEMGCAQGEVRVTPAGGHEGRLLLLAGAGVVSLGCSLNSLDANERAFRESDRGERADFEQRWDKATPLP